MKLSEERLKTINSLLGTQRVTVVICDLYDNFNNAQGTRVTLNLPLEGVR
ncbi:MAG TPA: hypothetical protein PLA69_09670 [Flavobacterium sp.]|nr:hypothetical protein [Flavobacterium sp.]